MRNNPHRDKVLKTIQKLGYVHSTWNVFNDFLEMCALAIANKVEVDKKQFDKREVRYRETMSKYQQEEQKLFPEMYADLVDALQYEITRSGAPVDVLGVIFHDLELHNKYRGQFFTPQDVCDFMGAITFADGSKDCIKEKGYASMYEPCCGSGAMCFGFAKAMADAGFNYCTQLVVSATEIDLKCVHMAYIQLSLYGIPAVVTHGNTITLEEWSHWFTPIYMLNGWHLRLRSEQDSNSDNRGEQTQRNYTDKELMCEVMKLFEAV